MNAGSKQPAQPQVLLRQAEDRFIAVWGQMAGAWGVSRTMAEVHALLYISGQIPIVEGKPIAIGRVPSQVSLELAQRCSVQCVLNGLAVAKAAAGSLEAIARVIRVGVFVACDQDFGDQPKVGNAASELLVAVFGDDGQHARAAVGAPALPLHVPVEIEFLFELTE